MNRLSVSDSEITPGWYEFLQLKLIFFGTGTSKKAAKPQKNCIVIRGAVTYIYPIAFRAMRLIREMKQ